MACAVATPVLLGGVAGQGGVPGGGVEPVAGLPVVAEVGVQRPGEAAQL
jgi:hypothetical protein